ncbi:MAG TPA: hypothetical protein VGC67_04875 [Cellulomonas sp.]
MTAARGRRTRRRPRAGLLLLALVATVLTSVLVTAGLAPASAARLDLSTRQITTTSAAACSRATIGATSGTVSGGSSTQVVLSSVPTACQGRSATVRLYAADGTALATTDTIATLAAAGTSTVTVPAYAVSGAAGVALTIGTWALPTSWTAPASTVVTGPVTPGPGTSFDQLSWTLLATSGTQACVSVRVSGVAGTVWRVDVHTDQRPWNGVTSGSGFQVQSPWWAQKLTTDPVDGVLSIGGSSGYETLTAGQTVTVTICHYGLPAPAYDSALSYTQTSQLASSNNVGYACLVTTVGVTGTAPFYAGWRAQVDLAPVIAYFASVGRTVNITTATVSAPGNYTLARLGGTLVSVAPTGWDTWGVSDSASQTFQVCVQ